ncbi:hypothetical protein VTL71DRAFT_837 [Oculimacula yallundae]|uniref:Aprataxin C2HE/C2H2/C2HC zinc finger domain-containing protein n=1 Tax=Oculimacula yallundae TaxID=86028 RepID=A0ABR4D172_9HELO
MSPCPLSYSSQNGIAGSAVLEVANEPVSGSSQDASSVVFFTGDEESDSDPEHHDDLIGPSKAASPGGTRYAVLTVRSCDDEMGDLQEVVQTIRQMIADAKGDPQELWLASRSRWAVLAQLLGDPWTGSRRHWVLYNQKQGRKLYREARSLVHKILHQTETKHLSNREYDIFQYLVRKVQSFAKGDFMAYNDPGDFPEDAAIEGELIDEDDGSTESASSGDEEWRVQESGIGLVLFTVQYSTLSTGRVSNDIVWLMNKLLPQSHEILHLTCTADCIAIMHKCPWYNCSYENESSRLWNLERHIRDTHETPEKAKIKKAEEAISKATFSNVMPPPPWSTEVALSTPLPMATIHFLMLPQMLLPRVLLGPSPTKPVYNSKSPIALLHDPKLLAIIKMEARRVRTTAALHLEQKFGSVSEQNQLRDAVLSGRVEIPLTQSIPRGRDWEDEIMIGVRAEPFLDRLVIEVVSRDLMSTALQTKTHYNTFATPFFISLDDFPMTNVELQRRQKCRKSNMKCWRCGKDFGDDVSRLKDHLKEEFDTWKRK